MTRSLDRLIEEKLRALIITQLELFPGEHGDSDVQHIQVRTSLLGAGEDAATLPRIVIKCQSQDTPDLFEAGVFRIIAEFSSIAEATSQISSDDLESMNTAVDRVIIFADNIPAALTSSEVLTFGVVHGGSAQATEGNRILRVRTAEIWSKLRNQPPFLDT